MTHDEQIEQLAKEIATKFYYSDNPDIAYRASRQGAIKASEAFLEKAYHWLKENTMKELCLSVENFTLVEEFIDSFKKAMEE